ncbi:AAA family ATPase [Thiocapsa roseopersicina]|uniref:AAA+-type ATPase, SpoVK/Ycf46/Vps4 family n=1 Tax=Thiocapsa roseopersicina TaxID=1058 RepID=A0A1H2YAG2_THIRO|nr:AAA family ATPase [Thiocapsa roseopersicina]SDX01549.1 AAA+-type ATPase, SpoVK/Ycf46/Vps4 family [Thiocapsa roseopersicina]
MGRLFENPAPRVFALYGNTGDHFYTPQLRELDLTTWLWGYLQSLGYQRVVLFSPDRKLHFLDEQSARLAEFGTAAHEQRAAPPRRLSGPLGGARLRGRPNAAAGPASPPPAQVRWDYGQMTDEQAGAWLNRLMLESVATAILIQNGEDLFSRLDDDAVRLWDARLGDWTGARLPPVSRNIAVLIFRGEITVATERFPRLRAHLFGANNAAQPLPDLAFRIGTARPDEVGALLHRLRLLGQLRWSPRQIADRTAAVARALVPAQDGGGLRSMAWLIHQVATLDLAAEPDHWAALDAIPSLARQVKDRLRALVEHARERRATAGPPPATRGPYDIGRLTPTPPARPDDLANLHLALLGSPGTGKTTLARLVAAIYRQEGLLATGHLVEVTARNLIEEHVGGTAKRTAEAIGRALGGVLFIDEAYSLKDNAFGKEAIAELVQAMTNHNGEFAVIIAGYTDPIIQLIEGRDANPGLARRFPGGNRWTLANYRPEELHDIFGQMLARQGREPDTALHEALPGAFALWHQAQDAERFGNAGEVRNLVEALMQRAGPRRVIVREDFATLPAWDQYLSLRPVPTLDEVLRPLDALIGLVSVKDAVRGLADTLAVQQRRGRTDLVPGHYLFQGNPGTGKTTVARIMGEIFNTVGLLARGHVVEVKREDLVGRYQGDAETNTKEQISRALDGVLFIDEAYQLAADNHDAYGRRAFETLLASMENHRARLCVILAGYPAEMQRLIRTNPGFESRLDSIIDFPDYDAAELLAMAERLFTAQELRLTDTAVAALSAHLRGWDARRGQPDFGNGRDVRKLVDSVVNRQAQRVRPLLNQLSDAELALIDTADIPE